MLGNMTVSHLRAVGGDQPNPRKVRGGLLGADYKVENGHYRFAKVYSGESWNPQLRAPLTQPGVNVAAGEYLLSVRGADLVPPQDLDQALEGTARSLWR
jgi:tricorn protease